MASEAERVGQSRPYVGLASLVRHVVQIAFRIGSIQIDRRRNDSVLQRQAEDNRFHAAGRALSPSEVHARMPGRVLLTSVRRAISNLTNAGALVKLDQVQPGPFGQCSPRSRG